MSRETYCQDCAPIFERITLQVNLQQMLGKISLEEAGKIIELKRLERAGCTDCKTS
jgi:hypothetical protein